MIRAQFDPVKKKKMAIPYSFLVLNEHPYGREMLPIPLVERGYQPDLILREDHG